MVVAIAIAAELKLFCLSLTRFFSCLVFRSIPFFTVGIFRSHGNYVLYIDIQYETLWTLAIATTTATTSHGTYRNYAYTHKVFGRNGDEHFLPKHHRALRAHVYERVKEEQTIELKLFHIDPFILCYDCMGCLSHSCPKMHIK